jgi:hypothetical protein
MTLENFIYVLVLGFLSLDSALFISMCGVNVPAVDKKWYFIVAFIFSFIFRVIFIVYNFSLGHMFEKILWGHFCEIYCIILGSLVIYYCIKHLYNKTPQQSKSLLFAISSICAIESLILFQPVMTCVYPTIQGNAIPEIVTIIVAVLLTAKPLTRHIFLQKIGFAMMAIFGLKFISDGLYFDFNIWYSPLILFAFFSFTIIYGRLKREK